MGIYGGMQMNKLRVIDLLNKIANGEEVPKVVKTNDDIFYYDETDDNEVMRYKNKNDIPIIDEYYLNDEVEIIEEDKKIEKFDPCLGGIMGFDSVENIFEIYKDKINEIIDRINNAN